MSTVRLDIEYDGSRFRGWARQPGQRTVQGELETALATVLGEPIELTVAGRTDTGVHAIGQVASFESGLEVPDALARRLNAVGPRDVTVTAAALTEDGFDARRDATSRTYRYRILARRAPSPFEQGRALWWPHRLDRDALDACASALPGTHDFTAFTPTQTEHVRFERQVLRAEWLVEAPKEPNPNAPQTGTPGAEGEEVPADVLQFWSEADAFMRNMVRVLVGTMLEVAAGRRSVDDFARLLEGAPREAAGDTARAHGLYLAAVRY